MSDERFSFQTCLLISFGFFRVFFLEPTMWNFRWKVLTLVHRILGQTSESDTWEWRNFQIIGFFWQLRTQLHSNLSIWNVTRSALSGQDSEFESSFYASGSVLSSARRIRAVRHTWKLVTHFLWKWSKMCPRNAWLRIELEARSAWKLKRWKYFLK